MSIASKIMDYMAALPPSEDGDYIPLDQAVMADAIGMPVGRLRNHMSAMAANGRWEWVKSYNPSKGKDTVIGFKNLRPPDGKAPPKMKLLKERHKKRVAAVKGEPEPIKRIRPVETPELDRLLEARTAMDRFVAEFPGMVDEARAREALRVDASKTEAYVAEGLSLLDRNRWLESQLHEVREKYATEHRELEYLRLKHNKQLQETLVTAGVSHSDPHD